LSYETLAHRLHAGRSKVEKLYQKRQWISRDIVQEAQTLKNIASNHGYILSVEPFLAGASLADCLKKPELEGRI